MAVAYVGSAEGRVEYGDSRCGDGLSSKRSGGLDTIRLELTKEDYTTNSMKVLI